MINITQYCINHSRAVIMLLFILLVFGAQSYIDIPKEDNPDIQIPIVVANVFYEGISPKDSEKLLVIPLENKLKNLDRLKKITSYSYSGGCHIILEFDINFDIKTALQDVRNKINMAKADLPLDLKDPTINEVNLSKFPIIEIALFGSVPELTKIRLAKSLKDKILQDKNILEVVIAGGRDEIVEIEVTPKIINSYNLDLDQLGFLVNNNKKMIAAGELSNSHGKFNLKIASNLNSVEDFKNIPIKVVGDRIVKLGDISNIKSSLKSPEMISRTNGVDSIILKISKRPGTNLIETVANIKKITEQEKKKWSENVNIAYALDQSEAIKETLSGLENNILLAIILSIFPVLIAIGAKTAILVALSIPLSFLMGIIFLKMIGYSLNIVVIFSLILSIGMLIDAAVVICEYADQKKRQGFGTKEAYIISAKHMWAPVFSATITTLIVFLPLFFWPGIVGQFMKYMPITITATVISSLIVAYLFLPVIANYIDNKKPEVEKTDNIDWFTMKYLSYLENILVMPKRFVVMTISSLVGVVVLYIFFGPPTEFFPKIEPEQAIISVHTKGNLSIWQKNEIAEEIEKRLESFRDVIKIYNTQVINQSEINNVSVSIIIDFTNWRYRIAASKIMNEIRQKLSDIPDVTIDIKGKDSGPSGSTPIQIEISGGKSEMMLPYAKEILAIMSKDSDFIDIETSFGDSEIEWELEINQEKAAKYGVSRNLIGSYLQLFTHGLLVSKYRGNDSNDESDVLLKYGEKDRTITNLDNIYVNSIKGQIPISNFVSRKAGHKLNYIMRVNNNQIYSIKSGLADNIVAETAIKNLNKKIASLEIPPEIIIKFVGEEEDSNETSAFLQNAFIIALLSMFIIILLQFNSFYQTMIVMSTIFFSTAGVLLGFLLIRQPFGIVMCGLGIITLAGTVVTSNIIFLDTYNKIKKESNSVKEAIMLTAKSRLRPILLTTITSVIGLYPMIIGLDVDFIHMLASINAPSAQWWKQLSLTIVGGMTFSTALTLFFTPALLMLEERLKKFILRF